MQGTYSVFRIIANASNIYSGENPPYTVDDFLAMHPKFTSAPTVMIQAWIRLANASLVKERWHDFWEVGMGLFIAHHLTLSMSADTSDQVQAGLTKGVVSSKSVGDLSVSYDYGSIASEFTGWGTYAQTTYGQQLVQFARLVGKGGMTVW